jgi:hypothetical protein
MDAVDSESIAKTRLNKLLQIQCTVTDDLRKLDVGEIGRSCRLELGGVEYATIG